MNQRQRGSVLSYSLIAVLLAILLIGGIVYFKNSSSKIAGPFQPTTEGTTSQDNSNRTAQNDAALKQQSNSQSSNSSSSSSSTTPSNSTSTATTGSSLPTTGPGELIVPFMGISVLTGFAVAYRRSRQAL